MDKRESKYLKPKTLCFAAGCLSVMLLSLSFVGDAFAFESAKFAIKELCGHMTGSLGGLLMSAAAVGGIAAAAFGNFRASFSFLITGIGAFTISALLSLHFPNAVDSCTGGNNNNANTPAADTANPQAGNPLGRTGATTDSDPFSNF